MGYIKSLVKNDEKTKDAAIERGIKRKELTVELAKNQMEMELAELEAKHEELREAFAEGRTEYQRVLDSAVTLGDFRNDVKFMLAEITAAL